MLAACNVGKRLVDGDPFDQRREIAEHLDRGIAEPLVLLEVAADEDAAADRARAPAVPASRRARRTPWPRRMRRARPRRRRRSACRAATDRAAARPRRRRHRGPHAGCPRPGFGGPHPKQPPLKGGLALASWRFAPTARRGGGRCPAPRPADFATSSGQRMGGPPEAPPPRSERHAATTIRTRAAVREPAILLARQASCLVFPQAPPKNVPFLFQA